MCYLAQTCVISACRKNSHVNARVVEKNLNIVRTKNRLYVNTHEWEIQFFGNSHISGRMDQ